MGGGKDRAEERRRLGRGEGEEGWERMRMK